MGSIRHTGLARAAALAQSSNLCPHRLRKRHARQSDVRLLVNTLGGERCGVPLELRRGRSCGRFDPGAGPLLTGVANQPGGRLLMGPAKPRPARQKWPSRRYGLGHGQVTGDVGSLVNAPSGRVVVGRGASLFSPDRPISRPSWRFPQRSPQNLCTSLSTGREGFLTAGGVGRRSRE